MNLKDFKSFCWVLKTSGVGSIPTHSRQLVFMYISNRIVPFMRPAFLAVCFVLITTRGAIGENAFFSSNVSCARAEYFLAANVDSAKSLRRTIGGKKQDSRQWTPVELKEILSEQAVTLSRKGGWKERKNPRLAMLCAILFPGLGQMYNEKPLKATIAMGIETYYLSQILLNHRYAKREEAVRDRYLPGTYHYNNHDLWVEEYKNRAVDWIWWSGGAIFLIVVDAYVDANLFDMRMHVSARAKDDGVECTFGFAF